MEGKGLKGFIAMVLVLVLVLGHVQVEAKLPWCCESETAVKNVDWCIAEKISTDEGWCAYKAGCVLKLQDQCEAPYPYPDSAAKLAADVSAFEEISR
ncbi:hypothetical protein ACP4OV_015649 [Aristida adscensionis]